MMLWDASAIIPLCVTEKSSEAMKRLLMADPLLAVWWASPIECCSAFARLQREGILDTVEEGLAKEPLHELMKAGTEIKPGQKVRDCALRLIATHPLRSEPKLFSWLQHLSGRMAIPGDTALSASIENYAWRLRRKGLSLCRKNYLLNLK